MRLSLKLYETAVLLWKLFLKPKLCFLKQNWHKIRNTVFTHSKADNGFSVVMPWKLVGGKQLFGEHIFFICRTEVRTASQPKILSHKRNCFVSNYKMTGLQSIWWFYPLQFLFKKHPLFGSNCVALFDKFTCPKMSFIITYERPTLITSNQF
jgi:hypothetical protein